MIDIRDALSKRVLIFDGAMGTSIQNLIKKDSYKDLIVECNEYLNITHPEIIYQIHTDFLNAGAQIIETNTFGAIDYLLKEYSLQDKVNEINTAGVKIAIEVANKFSTKDNPRFVSGSMGPGTKLLSIVKKEDIQVSFKDIYKSYYLQAEALIRAGVHLIQIETGQDPLLMKAILKAVLDVKEKLHSDVPIFMQATFQENGQMLVGTDVLTFINIFNGMPIDGLGINCGTGPQNMEAFIKIFSENSLHYISLLPNAGLPVLKNGEMCYDLNPDEFANILAELVTKYRINAIGGCCGTTFEYIKALSMRIESKPPKQNNVVQQSYLSSLFASQEIKVNPAPLIVGERANVNGSKKFKNLLKENKWDEMNEVCLTQQEEGAHILDICLMQLDRDEIHDMSTFLPIVNQSVSTPLMIDTTSYETVETALQFISGKPIVNSVNFENGDEIVVKYLKLCRDMNAALICLAIDEQGMAKTKQHKLQILDRFINLAKQHNYPVNQIFFDCLTFALSTGNEEYRDAGKEAIGTIKHISDNYPFINTIMGVSNVSFGLKPKIRKILNSVFLHECVKNGLNAAIVDSSKILPVAEIPEDVLTLCLNLIYNNREKSDPLLKLAELDVDIKQEDEKYIESIPAKDRLKQYVIKGRTNYLQETIIEMIEEAKDKPLFALEIINSILIPAMQEVGEMFERGKIQLPFVLKSAEVMKKSVDLLKPYMGETSSNHKETMLLATVQGDVHDIGKNLVQIILENNAYKVIDIGVKQSQQSIYQAIIQYQPDCLGMSALLIKSTGYMKETLEYLNSKDIKIPVVCGGAALNQDFIAKQLQPVYKGKVVYGRDAFSGLKFMQALKEYSLYDQEYKNKANNFVIDNMKMDKLPLNKVYRSNPTPILPFKGSHPVKNYPLSKFKDWLNYKFLYYSLWQFKPKDFDKNVELQKEINNTLKLMWQWAEEFVEPAYVYGYYQANSRDDLIIVYNAQCDDCGSCSVCNLNNKAENIAKVVFTGDFNGEPINHSLKHIDTGDKDIIAFQLVTLGERAVQKAKELKETDQYQNYFYWHGFCSALTEALAAKVHSLIRNELNLEEKTTPQDDFNHNYKGVRLSFGYEALPDIFEQNKVLDLLSASELGISMTESGMLNPEYTTCALVMHYLKNFDR
ncbi:MAG: homocysteine S-methyltransferase family protein [Candidatus Cloacimonetes bacterium]|nr:homocysteine S-methyltransferase family protein [Candidatus Cloacimonadota bacterium]MDD4155379.1 homocysteine S-methyltransferase family protein [Candidatus Cloacimonadota bacterium]